MKNHRYITGDIQSLCFAIGKMAFVSGPRQVGKTTMAKSLLTERGYGNYCNWDESTFRKLWAKDPSLTLPDLSMPTIPLMIYDEIHKVNSWKRSLKGIFDTLDARCDILVTGSARLDIYRKGGDSLLGRYYHFRLHPFSYKELMGISTWVEPDDLQDAISSSDVYSTKDSEEVMDCLFRYGPFPDPFFQQSEKQLRMWQRSRIERLVREDLRDISRISELSQVELLTSLLPDRVSSPVSIAALSRDLEVAYTTIKRWMEYLRVLYYCYEIKPYYRSVVRSIKKEGKLYLWDWSEIKSAGARFENMVASHLLKYCHYLQDTGYEYYELCYVRNKQQSELDFLIVKDKKPWLPIEVKLSDQSLSSNWSKLMPSLGLKFGIQLIQTRGVHTKHVLDGYEVHVMSADKFFKFLK